ncbi:helix-turn-helix domain-containing protein [Bacteroides faecium]|uniref:helix-turn-helix domain-containing protein n=1 Tax=Bacteroides faecium TaxID=2715212 RepID=UPI003510D1BD
MPSPLRIIYERIITEAKRLLQNSPEIANILRLENVCTFSHFFKSMTGENVSDYRKRQKKF